MSKSTPLQGYYDKIYQKIDRFLQAEKKADPSQLDWIRLNSYWKSGKLLEAACKKLEAEDFSKLRRHLSQKLKCETRQLLLFQQLYRHWPSSPPASSPKKVLPWSKYRELLVVEEEKARNFYLKETLSQDWSCRQLRQAIRHQIYQDPKQLKRYQKGELKRQRSIINTFWAQVLRVIDGDTLLVRVDLRFGSSLNLQLRLRGINCAELKDPSGFGEKAKAYTEGELKTSPWILLVTYKTDMFGRYVADVYYSPVYETEEDLLEKGEFLNQKLLSAGLAKRVEY